MEDPIILSPQADESIKATVINENFKKVSDRLLTNIIKDENGDTVFIFGKIALEDGTILYGLLMYLDGIPNLLLGTAPDGSGNVLVIAEPGENVLDAF